MACGNTDKDINNQNLVGVLSSDLAHTASWERNWLVAFNSSKTKLVTFHHHRTDPKFFFKS